MSPLFFFMGILFGYVWLPDFGGMVVGGLLGLLLAQLMALSQRLRELTRDLDVLKALVEPATDAKAQVEQNPVQNPAQGSGQQGSPPVTPEPISAAASVLEASDGSQGLVAATGRAAAPEQTEPVADARVKITDSPPLKDYQPAERELTAADRVFAAIKSYFTEGNLFIRVGVLVLFFGVAFLLNYAAEQGKFPIELRIAAIAAGGVALLVTGWRLRVQRTTYGLILQGAGVGVLYFTVYGSFRLYHLVPTTVAFPLMFLIGALAALLAVLQNARGLVVLGIAGGFLAPVLTSTGAGSHVALFSYYAFLNAAIVAIAWFRSWRMLNLLGFAFTFIIGTAWGVTRYRAEFFASTEPFLVLFFLLYVAIGYLFSIRQKPDLRGLVDGTLIFGTPLVGIALQASLVHRFEYGLAWSAAVLGVFYLVLAALVKRRANAQLPLLGQAYLALGVIFSSMAVPYAADGQTTVAVWALEGAAILWLGARQQQLLARLFALLLQLGAGVVFLLDGLQAGSWPFFDAVFVSAILLASAGLFSSWLVSQEYAGRRDWEKSLYPLLLVWGLCWWFGGFAQQLEAHYHRDFHFMATLAITLVTAAGFSYLARRLRWNTARTTALTLPPLLVVFALLTGNIPQHLGANGGWWVWPLAFATYYLLLWRGDQDETKNTGLPWLHAGTGLLLLVFIGWEGHWHLVRVLPDRSIWLISFWALPPLVALSVMVRGNFWPLLQYRQAYLARLGMPLIGWLWAWSLLSHLSDAAGPPLAYLPLLNIIDMTLVLALLVSYRWWQSLYEQTNWGVDYLRPAQIAMAGTTFLWLNVILLRTLHHWADIRYQLDELLESWLVQTSLSIFWTLTGMAIMVVAARGGLRKLWLIGSGLLGVVVVKLFVVDQSASDTVERIVSFIIVGLLLMAIGYFAPIPPKVIGAAFNRGSGDEKGCDEPNPPGGI